MPAATPSQSKVENVLRAMVACGVHPRVIAVAADGSFTIEAAAAVAPTAASVAEAHSVRNDEPPSWDDYENDA